ncbi:YbaB/EbfC family nucleoid-associated protein [Nocardia sp. NEAU-G5]|uniref:YbaB/EbfC family nucleoid-associated protein n=1 Tax=Nocardia albiluteola TaxID=2842303 RepID=A0ABS6B3Q1_9NOCA|nr:YbaB/EbfC family nucleoid-associated protein [Nocardia albiluteola]MBU3064869.1 YbaB/EbfC family nucleoid-associated protein [Nocardia albiluteola]
MADNEFDSAMADFRAQVADITRLRQERAQLTATATAAQRRVSVTVNADGIAVDVRFSGAIDDLSYEEIAQAVTEASRQAVADVARQKAGLQASGAAAPRPMDLGSLAAVMDSLRDILR